MDVMPHLNPPRREGLAHAQPSLKQHAAENTSIPRNETQSRYVRNKSVNE